MNLLRDLIEYLKSGCSHSRYSFPITLNGRTYVVCGKCGSEANYCFEQMRIVK